MTLSIHTAIPRLLQAADPAYFEPNTFRGLLDQYARVLGAAGLDMGLQGVRSVVDLVPDAYLTASFANQVVLPELRRVGSLPQNAETTSRFQEAALSTTDKDTHFFPSSRLFRRDNPRPIPDIRIFDEQKVGDGREFLTDPRFHIPHIKRQKVLGQGSSSLVLGGYDLLRKEMVAIKYFRPFEGKNSDIDCIQNEYFYGSRLPGVVRVYEIGQASRLLYLEMELMDKGSVASQAMNIWGDDPDTKSVIIRNILEAVAIIHRAGVVHCDIKPANILMYDDIHIKLGDLSLMRTLLDKPLDIPCGTEGYIAPECLKGKSLRLSPSRDVYSLGVSLYEVLTGEDVSADFAPEEAQDAVRESDDIEDRLKPLLISCLEKKPSRRLKDGATALAFFDKQFPEVQEFL